jgi:D-sedoheptulose 7-phosphate isomerase
VRDWISDYIRQQKAALDSIPVEGVAEVIGAFRDALKNDRHIFIFGNGGSAANSSHFITDLGKGASDKLGSRFRCLSLNDNMSWMTALGNEAG